MMYLNKKNKTHWLVYQGKYCGFIQQRFDGSYTVVLADERNGFIYDVCDSFEDAVEWLRSKEL